MGQIIGSAAKPKRCNANQLSQVPTPAAGEYILVSSDNSMNAAGQGNFDCYIVGNGNTAATALELRKIDEIAGGYSDFDLSISDENGYDIVQFADGHIKTKNFNSITDVPISSVDSIPDLGFSDNEGNVLVEFADGHIKTKNFDSRNAISSQRKLNGKVVAFLGDSITAGSSASSTALRYSSLFCESENCIEINLGVSGTCIAANTSNELRDQRFITRATAANLSACDVIFVWGGTNDFSYDIKAIGQHFAEETITGTEFIGTKKLVAPSDTETFAGALHELILQIKSVAPNAQLFFIQPLNRGRYNSIRPTSAESNANGNYLEDFRKAIKDICTFYAVPTIDMNVMIDQDWQNDTSSHLSSYSADGLHPNTAGHKRIADLLVQWVENNITI